MKIHPTAIVDSDTILRHDVEIGPYAVIGPEVVLQDRTRILSHAVVSHATIGADCVVYPYVSIGLEPQHLKYKGEKTRVVIGAGCVFREGVTVHRGTALDQSVTTIGDNCYLMAMAHVAHDCRVGSNVIMANGAQLAGHAHVGDSVFLSALCGIHQFVRIGKGALVSGGAMVPLDVAPFCMAQGDRASIKGLNVVGMRRNGLNRNNIKAVKEAYQIVFLSNLPLQEALSHSALLVDDSNVALFRSFFLEPKRGFLRPSGKTSDEILEEVSS